MGLLAFLQVSKHSFIMKEYDIAVFGATGLTGKHIVEHVYQQMPHLPSNFTWAVAGRNPEALTEIVNTFSKQYPNAVPPAIVEANVVKRPTLDALAKAAKVIINAVGPFRFLGEYVVRACVEQGCDYVDVTGEPEFVERMQRTYHDQAKKNKVTLVHCCGFDSVSSPFLSRRAIVVYRVISRNYATSRYPLTWASCLSSACLPTAAGHRPR